jgi:hypothetical protein
MGPRRDGCAGALLEPGLVIRRFWPERRRSQESSSASGRHCVAPRLGVTIDHMALDKHIAPPATAREIRRVLGITENDRAAAGRLLALTAEQHAVSRRTGPAQNADKATARPSAKARSSKRSGKAAAAGKNRTGVRKGGERLTYDQLDRRIKLFEVFGQSRPAAAARPSAKARSSKRTAKAAAAGKNRTRARRVGEPLTFDRLERRTILLAIGQLRPQHRQLIALDLEQRLPVAKIQETMQLPTNGAFRKLKSEAYCALRDAIRALIAQGIDLSS